MKRYGYALTAIIYLLVCSLAFGQAQGGQSQQGASFEQRLGPDDGAALAILFGANMRGNLDLCDCNYPRGGLARRVGYV
ncbi:MAG TPA: hypothetical protein VNO14_17715, partial [Blastocatellia bacterium]|nr:hypothetical protein [Blastocatellia bacterium]